MTAQNCLSTDMILKTVVFRIVSFVLTLIAARLWFGDWHITSFQLFLLPYCTIIYYVFEIVWRRPHAR